VAVADQAGVSADTVGRSPQRTLPQLYRY